MRPADLSEPPVTTSLVLSRSCPSVHCPVPPLMLPDVNSSCCQSTWLSGCLLYSPSQLTLRDLLLHFCACLSVCTSQPTPGRSRSLRALLTGAMHRRSNTTIAGNSVGAGTALQHQQSMSQREGPVPDDVLTSAEVDALDDLDDILHAMQPPEMLNDNVPDRSSGAAAAAAPEEAAANPIPTTAIGPPSARPSASQLPSLLSRVRGSNVGGGSKTFWQRSSTRLASSQRAGDTTTESPYTGSLHGGFVSAAAALTPSSGLSASSAPPETLPLIVAGNYRTPFLQAPAPPGVIESRPSTDLSETGANVAIRPRCQVSGVAPPAGITLVDSMDGDLEALGPSGAASRSLHRSSISTSALARGGAEAVLPPAVSQPVQEQVDGAVITMLASLVEAPQHVLRRYRLLQLTHGLDLQDLLRDHSEQAAAAAIAAAAATGSSHPSGAEGQLLTGTRSDAWALASSAPPVQMPSTSLQDMATANGGQVPPRWPAAGSTGGDDSLCGGSAAAAVLATAAANGSVNSASGGETSQGTNLSQAAAPPGVAASPFAQAAFQSTMLPTVAAPPGGPMGVNVPGIPGAGAATALSAAGVVSANLAGELLRTLSSAAASENGEGTCGVCFDQPDVLAITGCGHHLCADCSRELCKLNTFKPVLCPFCRGMIGGFKFVGRS